LKSGRNPMGTSGKCSEGDIDLRSLIYEAIAQIPEGKVASYADIASAVGDIKAARAVGMVLAESQRSNVVPHHRVIYSDGRVDWNGDSGSRSERKIDLLQEEGVIVDNGAVADLDTIRFTGFHVRPILRELAARQERLRRELVSDDDFGELRLVAGLDVSYIGDHAFGAVVVHDIGTGERVSQSTVETNVCFPYVPGYLAFREIPVLRPLVTLHKDIIYLIDGHGVLHPRGFGIASMIGVELDAPTVGAAKSLLVGSMEQGGLMNRRKVLMDGRVQGCRIGGIGRSATYVSVGHRVSLATAVNVCERLMHSSVPEPLREAHRLANSMRCQFEKEGRS
jgi:deoxyribonuclease V